jgi:hypothetical protein
LTGNATPPAQDDAGDCDPIPAPADEGEPVPMSLACDASDRTFDRQLAHLGLLDDAAPLFRDGSLVPGAGRTHGARSSLPRSQRTALNELKAAFAAAHPWEFPQDRARGWGGGQDRMTRQR